MVTTLATACYRIYTQSFKCRLARLCCNWWLALHCKIRNILFILVTGKNPDYRELQTQLYRSNSNVYVCILGFYIPVAFITSRASSRLMRHFDYLLQRRRFGTMLSCPRYRKFASTAPSFEMLLFSLLP